MRTLAIKTRYHPEAPPLFRKAGGVWRKEARVWEVPIPAAPSLAETLKDLGLEEAQKAGEEAQAALEAAREAVESAPLATEEQRRDALLAFAAFLSAFEGGPKGFLLANGTGTGKTYVYGAFVRGANALGERPVVVVPNEDLARQTREVLEALGAEAELTTYGRLDPDEARGRVLVLDEAHLAKRGFRSDRGARTWKAVRRAAFALFSTATPFDRPWESEYLLVPTGALERWGYEDFASYMREFKVYTREGFGGGLEYYFAGGPEDLLRFHESLRERGFMTRRLFRPPEGMVEHEVPLLSLPAEERELLALVRRRLKEAALGAPPEKRGLVMAQRTMLSRALLERFKLKAAFPLVESLLEEGWHVALFLQYRGEKELDLSSPEALAHYLDEAEERGLKELHRFVAHALKGLSLRLPSPLEMVEARFGHLGDALAFYTGREGTGALRRAKERWGAGEVRLLVATAGKGGTGLSLHDTRGDRPTAQIVLTLPWTGSQLDQILGRVVRVGLASKVRILLPAAKVPVERHLAAVVAGSLRTLGYAVRGGELPVPERVVKAFLTDYAAVDEEGFLRLLSPDLEEVQTVEK